MVDSIQGVRLPFMDPSVQAPDRGHLTALADSLSLLGTAQNLNNSPFSSLGWIQ